MAESTEQRNRSGNKRGMHPKSLANLIPNRMSWKPGTSGNPEGLSLKRRVSDVLREPKRSLSKEETKKVKAIELLARAIVEDAIKGSKEDRKEIWERLDGKLSLGINMAGDVEITYTIGKGYANGGGVGHATGQPAPGTPSVGHPGDPNNAESRD